MRLACQGRGLIHRARNKDGSNEFDPYKNRKERWIPAFEAVSQLPRSRTINELKNINKKQIKPLFSKTFN